MKNNLLHIELLKFLINKSPFFGFVEIKSFLLDNFQEEPNLRERKKINDFLTFLSSEEYIEIQSKYGIWIIQEAGIKILRKDISAIVKIKPKGVSLVEKNTLNKYNKSGILLSSILGISTFLLTIYTLIITQDISELKNLNYEITKENKSLKETNLRIKKELFREEKTIEK
jgi:hypothetical protein